MVFIGFFIVEMVFKIIVFKFKVFFSFRFIYNRLIFWGGVYCRVFSGGNSRGVMRLGSERDLDVGLSYGLS